MQLRRVRLLLSDPTIYRGACYTLRGRQRAFQKKKTDWLAKGDGCRSRLRMAEAKGFKHTRANYLLESVLGGTLGIGLVQGTENLISASIQRIESLSHLNLPQGDGWKTWHSSPDQIDDNMRAIEEYLGELWNLVKDGGELHGMVAAKSVVVA